MDGVETERLEEVSGLRTRSAAFRHLARIVRGAARYNKMPVVKNQREHILDLPERTNPSQPGGGAAGRRAYLVIRRGGRWSDVLRLSPNQASIIGRSSDNAVVIRSHSASRKHAKIEWQDGHWWLSDLGSRNGTRAGGEPIQATTLLHDGTPIEIAGFELVFTTRLGSVLGTDATSQSGPRKAASATDDQLTLGGPGSLVTTRRIDESRYLDAPAFKGGQPEPPPQATDPAGTPARSWQEEAWGWSGLFHLAYRLAECGTVREAAERTLEVLTASLPDGAGSVRVFRKSDSASADAETLPASEPIAAMPASESDGSLPPSGIVSGMLESGRAVLVRGPADELIRDDFQAPHSVATPRTGFMLVPIERWNKEPALGTNPSSRWWGYLHLRFCDQDAKLTEERLELASAAAGVLGAAVENLLTRGRLIRSLNRSRRAVDSLRQRLEESARMVGTSPAMVRLEETIRRLAGTNTTVLITGESGVGKELVANAIHEASPRRDGPLICLNCAALSPSLLESELFGHEKGAFTGATEQKKGKFELADGGTLMLDEIGELDLGLQAKLLRVLEGHAFERLGGQQSLRVDVRLVAATNRDLAAEVAAGRFRGDLYYRLNVIEIQVPPLRERPGDIRLLAAHYAAYFGEKTGRVMEGITEPAYLALEAHTWPGNVRELKNVIERAVVLGQDRVIDLDDLTLPSTAMAGVSMTRQAQEVASTAIPSGASAWPSADASRSQTAEPSTASGGNDRPLPSLAELERDHVLAVLRSTEGNKSRAAEILGIERSTLDRKLKRYQTATTKNR